MRSRLVLTLLCPLIALFASLLGVSQASAAHRAQPIRSAHAAHRTSKRLEHGQGRKSHVHRSSKHKRSHPHLKKHGKAAGGSSAAGTGRGAEHGAVVPAACQNGARPIAGEEGAFACKDGSEPTCPQELVATVSEDGSTLLCEAEPGEEGETEGEEAGEGAGAGEPEYDSSD
ncbi:MAG TPA: hypothetical protein VL972_06350 [Solirubrobacteraceae bacterium]|nr:hypothetical protein [Solirubrobacteraceae bacterium]